LISLSIIEVNARLSRSSALASKATGYPLAFVAAKLGLGMQMSEVNNAVTKVTQACFEPSLDYCVTKIPRWDLSKFENVSTKIGSAMKSVGEVMSIGRNWEESLQKAMRMVDPSIRGFETRKTDKWSQGTEMEEELLHPSDRRIFAIAQCLREGTHSVEQLHDITSIDNWFLQRLQNIVTGEKKLTKTGKIDSIDVDQMRNLKQLGFSDIQIASIVNSDEDTVRATRKSLGVKPAIKQIDVSRFHIY
jgi:lantibiotic modifying enzyme